MRYIVMSSSCNSPAAKRWAGYRNLAIVELQPGYSGRPAMISERAKGVRRIVAYRHSVYVGSRGAGADLLSSYTALAAELSAVAQS